MSARAVWYARRVAELWTDLTLRPRDAVALHLLISDVAFLRPLPEDEDELRRVVGVSAELWRAWPEIADLWPCSGLRRGRARARMNPALGDAFSDATGACEANHKRAKKAASVRWKASRAGDAQSIAPSMPGAMQRDTYKQTETEKQKDTAPGGAAESVSLNEVKGTPEPPKVYVRMSADRASSNYSGGWYFPHQDGVRWLTEDSTRPDGSSIRTKARDPELCNRVYTAMNAARDTGPR